MSQKEKNIAILLSFLTEKDNSVISPYGITTVLAMVAEGASEESLIEILETIDYASLEESRDTVLAFQNVDCAAFSNTNKISLLKGENELEFLKQFKQIVEKRYNAYIQETASAGKASLRLKNITTFKAEWLHTMERDTKPIDGFHNADGSGSKPAFLSATHDYLHYYESTYENGVYTCVKAVALPYKLGDERIPYELVLLDYEKEMTAEVLGNIFANMSIEECKVVFPEFTIKSKLNLVPMMESLGLKIIFNENLPAFDKIANEPFCAEAFTQKAEIEVDKNGTIAIATTEMEDSHIGDFLSEIPELVFNKPSYYFVRNTTTGEIVFMGKVNKLSDYDKQKPMDVSGSLRFWC